MYKCPISPAGKQEDLYQTVIYQCDYTDTVWTRKCLRQADNIFIVALAAEGPAVTDGEKQLERLAMKTKKDLVLLHSWDTLNPTGTRTWLRKRPWISTNFHMKLHPRMTRL